MKKKILLFALVAIMAFSAIVASANDDPAVGSSSATVSLKSFYPKGDSYSITYNVGAENATAQYGMIVVKGTRAEGNLDTSEILYIGQEAADDAGNIKFKNFAPMGASPSDLTEFKECTVYIGGQGFSTAQEIGVLKNGSALPIRGKIVDNASAKPATIKVVSDGEELDSVNPESDGTFVISAPAGENYSVVITKPGYLSYTITGVDVADEVALPDVNMTTLAGDVDGNGEIKIQDIQTLLKDYNATSDFKDADSDVDGNGEVKIQDIQALLKGYNGTNVSIAFVAQ